MEAIINKLTPNEIVRLGGAGNKCCNLALNNVDAYIHPSPGLCYWDLCANEPLIKAMGGYATDLYGERITFDIDKSPKLKGLIASC
jgi:3'(2'), 5'-bisphosphate nucleotidase